jgi:hypothetical protein
VFASRSLEISHIQHDHGNGQWSDMVEDTEASSATEDPERGWLRGRIFHCTTCEDSIRIETVDPSAAPVEPLT